MIPRRDSDRGRTRGFTLIELLVVISIIALLSSVVLSSLNSARGKARYAQAVSQMRQIDAAAELFFAQNGYFPGDAGIGAMPAGLSSYIASWPAGPCSNLVYDWNWFSSGNNVHVDLRTVSPSASVGYFCVYNNGVTCGSGATDILQMASKQLSC